MDDLVNDSLPTPRYSYAIDPDGHTTANKVLRLVGTGKNVLELGCGPGMMTRYLKEHAGCTVTAVEIDVDLAELARPYCERMVVADLETLDFSAAFNGQRFAVVIAADVLEHLKDPWRCLRAVRELLAPEGYLVVSIPNIAHGAVIAQLLRGRFPYLDKGLLDRTHIRFFTRHDVEDLLLACGFMPTRWEHNLVPPEQTEFSGTWAQLPPPLRAALAEAGDSQVYQFIVQAYPSTQAGWLAKTRAEMDEKNNELYKLSQELTTTQASLAEHQKAFAEAREIIAARDQTLVEYSKALEEAKVTLAERTRALEETSRAFAEAREFINRLHDGKEESTKRYWSELLRQLLRRLGRD